MGRERIAVNCSTEEPGERLLPAALPLVFGWWCPTGQTQQKAEGMEHTGQRPEARGRVGMMGSGSEGSGDCAPEDTHWLIFGSQDWMQWCFRGLSL